MKGLGIIRMAFYGHEWSEQTVDWTLVLPEVADELARIALAQEPIAIETGVCTVRSCDVRWLPARGLEVRVTFLGRG